MSVSRKMAAANFCLRSVKDESLVVHPCFFIRTYLFAYVRTFFIIFFEKTCFLAGFSVGYLIRREHALYVSCSFKILIVFFQNYRILQRILFIIWYITRIFHHRCGYRRLILDKMIEYLAFNIISSPCRFATFLLYLVIYN